MSQPRSFSPAPPLPSELRWVEALDAQMRAEANLAARAGTIGEEEARMAHEAAAANVVALLERL